MEMGEKIQKLRLEKEMTLEQLGSLVGVGKSTVRKWENGMIANMRRDKIAKIADALCVSPGYLMGWEDRPAGTAATAASSDSSVSSIDRRKNQINTYYDRMSDEGKQLLLERSKELLKLGYTESGENDVSRSCFSDDDAEGIA